MEVITVALVAVGLGMATAAVARRYDRDPVGWGLFGTFLFVIALPLLLLLGRRHTGSQFAHGRPKSARDAVRRSQLFMPLGYLGAATFDELEETLDVSGQEIEADIDRLLALDLLDTDGGRWVLSGKGRALHPDPALIPEPPEPIRSDQTAQDSEPEAADHIVDRLQRLKRLRAEALIDDDEYASQRARILGDL